MIRKPIETLRQFTGKPPRGRLGPGLTETWETLDMLAEEGIENDSGRSRRSTPRSGGTSRASWKRRPPGNAGRTWRPRGRPHRVFTHDFPGKAIPYGTYDVAQDQAVVNVGVSHDTAAFAVESTRRWWRLMGQRAYPAARRLLICADAGGSNGNRLRAWKVPLQRLADQLQGPITVCHYPPGTSKWNTIEHRLFSFISMNWKGQPLVSYAAVVNLIGRTRTRSGLVVKALLDPHEYETGQPVTPAEFKALRVKGHSFHPDWNYTLMPRDVS